ncbi:MAG: hypothetical protein ACRDTC_02615 [Pseudonocardiaceae bacterium]
MAPFTVTDADHAAERLTAEDQTVLESLMKLEDDLAVPTGDRPGARLATARQLCRRGRWRQLATELAALERDAEATLQRAPDLLWSAPCDLAIAAAAVAEFQDAVNATTASGGGK